MFVALFSTLVCIVLACMVFLRVTGRSVFWYYRRFLQQIREGMHELYFFLDIYQLWALNLLFIAALMLLSALLNLRWWLALSLCLSALAVPFFLLHCLRRYRRQKIEQQLPDFVQALSAALQAGAGVQRAFQSLGARTPAPLGVELRLVLRQLRLGLSMTQALTALHQRTHSPAILLLRACLELAQHQGGGVAESLQHLALSLRQTVYLRLRMRALTAQARLQAWVMCILPFALAAVLYGLDPAGYGAVWISPVGAGAALLLLFLMALGVRMIVLILQDLE